MSRLYCLPVNASPNPLLVQDDVLSFPFLLFDGVSKCFFQCLKLEWLIVLSMQLLFQLLDHIAWTFLNVII